MSAVHGLERASSAAAAAQSDGARPSSGSSVARPAWKSAIEISARLVIAGVLVYAAIGKLGDLRAFAQDIDNYRMLPETWVAAVAITLPTLELVVAAALVSGIGARGASIVATGMMVMFAVGMAQALARGIDLSCGCFGRAATTTVSGWTIARNVALAVLAAVPLWTGITRWSDLLPARKSR